MLRLSSLGLNRRPSTRRGGASRAPTDTIEGPVADARAAQHLAERERDALALQLRQVTDPAWSDVSRRGLFIIGSPRTGTTILQNALNASREIYLFGEAHLHAESASPDFIGRYNEMHRAWGNLEVKSTHCPPILSSGADWKATLLELAKLYRYVGDKIVLMSLDTTQTMEFYARNFYGSRYIFTFREPHAAMRSAHELIRYAGSEPPKPFIQFIQYLTTIRLYLYMLRNFPNTYCVFHENISPESFSDIGNWLNLDLSDSYSYYDNSQIKDYGDEFFGEEAEGYYNSIVSIYETLKQEAATGFKLVQLSQNLGNRHDDHLTPLSQLASRVDSTIDELKALTAGSY